MFSIYTLKRLFVVLAIALTVFYFAKPIALRFMSGEDFTRRRFVWIALTVVSFLSPSFWLYVLIAAPMYVWAYRKDSNTTALYLLMLHVIPPAGFSIPILGSAGLFDLNNYRLLAICVLVPASIRYRKTSGANAGSRFGLMDVLLLGLGALAVALYVAPDLGRGAVPIPDSPANMLRRLVLFFLDTYVVYYAVSRTCQSRRQLMDAVATFCLACALMAAIGLFENLRHWLLYVELEAVWGVGLSNFTWLTRGNELRAQASTGHSLALGFLLAVGFGFWLYLKSNVDGAMRRIGMTVLLWGGLIAAYSRGPWLGAVTAYFAFFAAGPRALSRVVKGGLFALGAGLLLLISPMGDRILSVLPIMGKTEDGNMLYRHHLADRGWEIVMAHPVFGNQFPWPQLEDLRQGEGIIDIVNTYLGIALNYGLVGLSCFLGFILVAMMTVYARTRVVVRSDPDLALLGTGLIAATVGALVMLQSCSFVLGCEKMFYVLAGLAAAYASLTQSVPHTRAALSARASLQA